MKDYTVTQMTDLLLAALKTELAKTAAGEEMCSFTKQPGDGVALDYAECGGMAWVRLVDTTPSISGRGNDITEDSCYWGLSHQIEIGVMRPAPIPEENLGKLKLPDDEELSAAADTQLEDMRAMHRAILTCRGDFPLTPTSYTPVGPVGGALGGTWGLSVWEE